MPRARLSDQGPDIAKPGFDVDTASIGEMQFSSSMVAARIIKTGLVTPGPFAGYMSDKYYQSIVYFDTPLPRPPVVLVAGIYNGTTTDQTPFLYFRVNSQEGMTYATPYYEIRTFTNRFELCTALSGANTIRPMPATWRYWVFGNTLEI